MRRKRRYLRYRYLAAFVLLVMLSPFLIMGADLLKPLPRKTTVEDRLAMFPTNKADVLRPVKIYWNDYQIPYIVAQTDEDAAYALGMIHAHLRLGQMEMARRIVYGRLSEVAGPVANDVDHTLRVIDYPKYAKRIYKAMPLESKRWLDHFVEGVNYYITEAEDMPHEFDVFGLGKELWKPEQIIAVGRLGGTDYSWLIWHTLLNYRDSPKWEAIWNIMLEAGTGRIYERNHLRKLIAKELNKHSFEGWGTDEEALLENLMEFAKFGSNSLVVGPSRSKNGAALIANDPHLGLSLPNLWFIAGMYSPSYKMVGMQAPALPVFAFGRNQHIAWGGTNLHASNSDLFDVSHLKPSEFETVTEKIKNRFWLTNDVTYRTTRYGPVISDAPLIPKVGERTLALKWMGHGMSDEITAMLSVNQSSNWDEFRTSLKNFSAPAQNLLYADIHGHIGKLAATQIPNRSEHIPKDIFTDTKDYDKHWSKIVGSDELPSIFMPEEGYLVSANDALPEGNVPVGYFFSPPDRANRLSELVEYFGELDVEALKKIQTDVFSASSLILRDWLIAKMVELDVTDGKTVESMQTWDGYYHTDSRGALAYQAFVAGFARELYGAMDSMDELHALEKSAYFDDFLASKAALADDEMLRDTFIKAIAYSDDILDQYDAWGDIHHLEIKHLLSNIPFIGKRYILDSIPTGGSRETVMKRAHGLIEDQPKGAYFGAQARHISDLSDPDANYFVLMGGQDGWLESQNFADQVKTWHDGKYIHMPLSLEKVRQTFPHVIELNPQE